MKSNSISTIEARELGVREAKILILKLFGSPILRDSKRVLDLVDRLSMVYKSFGRDYPSNCSCLFMLVRTADARY